MISLSQHWKQNIIHNGSEWAMDLLYFFQKICAAFPLTDDKDPAADPACKYPVLINLRQQVHSPIPGLEMKSHSGTPPRRGLFLPQPVRKAVHGIQASPEHIVGKRQDTVRPQGKQIKYQRCGSLQKCQLSPRLIAFVLCLVQYASWALSSTWSHILGKEDNLEEICDFLAV